MSCEKIQRQEPLEREEEALHLLQETAIMDSSSFLDDPTTVTTTNRFSNLHITTHPPCSTCGCSGSGTPAPSSSSVSHNYKRPSSEPALPPNPKKHNANSLSAFSKTPPPTTAATSSSSLSPSQPPIRRTVSDPCNPLTKLVAAESPQSPPQKNADIVACSGTPTSAAKLPPRPPTLRRSVSEPMPSPAKTFLSSWDTGAAYESANARLARRMSTCFHEVTRKLDELLTIEGESGSREDTITNQINQESKNQNDATTGNSEEGYVETVAEKIGEFLSIRLTCPCGQSYQILLSGHNCYYRVS